MPFSIIAQDISCDKCNDLDVTLAANCSAGTTTWTVDTQPTGSSLVGQTGDPFVIPTGNAEGVYTISYLCDDGSGCTAGGVVTVNLFSVPVLSAVIIPSCNNDGEIDLTIAGGSNCTIAWTGPGGFTATTEDITALIAGDYTVIVTCDGGCEATATYTVSGSSITANPTCN